MRPVTEAFVANIHHYVAAHGLDLVHFRKGERKDDVAQLYLAEATRADGSIPEGILFAGRAQEKALVSGTQKRRNPVTGATARLCCNGNEYAKRQAAQSTAPRKFRLPASD